MNPSSFIISRVTFLKISCCLKVNESNYTVNTEATIYFFHESSYTTNTALLELYFIKANFVSSDSFLYGKKEFVFQNTVFSSHRMRMNPISCLTHESG